MHRIRIASVAVASRNLLKSGLTTQVQPTRQVSIARRVVYKQSSSRLHS